MALTLTVNNEGVVGDLRYKVLSVAFDSSYPTGGESLTPGDLGWDSIALLLASPTGGLSFDYNYSGELLLAYEQGLTTGSTGAGDESSFTNVEDIAGAETAMAVANVAIDTTIRFGALRQVGNTSNLATIAAAVRVLAFGR
jgi:hypothetical protein